MTGETKVVIGVPLYNHAEHLAEALESFLSQSYRNLALVLVDDGSTDETFQLVQRYAAHDDRICYVRNEARLGYIRNACKAYTLAVAKFPTAEYFAWGSDHDVWHPRWLNVLVDAMEQSPEVVLAYPLNTRISKGGEMVRLPWTFETFGMRGRRTRFRFTCRRMSAGSMIYGLYRVKALERTGLLRLVLLPDRLLLAELALLGQFRQVPEILWYRRYVGLASITRQIRASFPEKPPLYLLLPWWITHAASLGWRLGVHGTLTPTVSRLAGLGAMSTYFLLTIGHLLRRALRARRKRFRSWLVRRLSMLRQSLPRATPLRIPRWQVRPRLPARHVLPGPGGRARKEIETQAVG